MDVLEEFKNSYKTIKVYKISLLSWVWMSLVRRINSQLLELEKFRNSYHNHSSCRKFSQEEKENLSILMQLSKAFRHFWMVKEMNIQKMDFTCKELYKKLLKKVKN